MLNVNRAFVLLSMGFASAAFGQDLDSFRSEVLGQLDSVSASVSQKVEDYSPEAKPAGLGKSELVTIRNSVQQLKTIREGLVRQGTLGRIDPKQVQTALDKKRTELEGLNQKIRNNKAENDGQLMQKTERLERIGKDDETAMSQHRQNAFALLKLDLSQANNLIGKDLRSGPDYEAFVKVMVRFAGSDEQIHENLQAALTSVASLMKSPLAKTKGLRDDKTGFYIVISNTKDEIRKITGANIDVAALVEGAVIRGDVIGNLEDLSTYHPADTLAIQLNDFIQSTKDHMDRIRNMERVELGGSKKRIEKQQAKKLDPQIERASNLSDEIIRLELQLTIPALIERVVATDRAILDDLSSKNIPAASAVKKYIEDYQEANAQLARVLD
jgi:hypothetical protein